MQRAGSTFYSLASEFRFKPQRLNADTINRPGPRGPGFMFADLEKLQEFGDIKRLIENSRYASLTQCFQLVLG